MTPARRLAPAFAAIAAGFPACVHPHELVESDVRTVREEVQSRARTLPPRWDPEARDPGLPASLRALLQGELDEDAAVRIALANNRDVFAAYEHLGIARADVIQAGLLKNPVFSASARFRIEGGTILELGLTQSFLDIFYRPLRQRIAEHELGAAIVAVTRDLVHLSFGVRRAFVHVRAAQQLVELQQSALSAATASFELMQQLHAAGNVIDPVLTSERVAVVRARLDLAEAELAARDARERLTVLLGLWGEDTGWVVSGNLGDAVTAGIDLTSVESRSIRASLELATNRAHLDASAQHAGLTSWQSLLPGAEAGALAEREAGGDWSIGPGITWELPLLDTGQAAALSARAKVQQRLHRHVQIAVEVRSAARMLRDRLALLGDRVEFVRTELLPTQARLVRETLQNYNAMQLGAFEVLMRKSQQIAAGHEYLTALRDAWLTRLDLEEILAGSLPESRRTPMWPDPKRTPNSRSSGGH